MSPSWEQHSVGVPVFTARTTPYQPGRAIFSRISSHPEQQPIWSFLHFLYLSPNIAMNACVAHLVHASASLQLPPEENKSCAESLQANFHICCSLDLDGCDPCRHPNRLRRPKGKKKNPNLKNHFNDSDYAQWLKFDFLNQLDGVSSSH